MYILEMRTPGHILQILKCGERLIEAADKTQGVGFFFRTRECSPPSLVKMF